LYPLSELSFRIAKTKSTSQIRDFSVQPPSSVLRVQQAENYTDIQATLPLTADKFEIRWVEIEAEEVFQETVEANATKVKDQKRAKVTENAPSAPQVTVTHEVMHTVGEGVLRSLHSLEFATGSSDGAPLNSVEFLVQGEGVRVTSVLGHALQGWTSEDVKVNVTGVSSSARLVKATFKTSQVGSTIALQVNTETDRGSSAQAEVELPRIDCKNVLRQTGMVGVVKDANVEVHEQQRSGLTRIEPSELSSRLRLNVDRPIVLSYKYLNPQNKAVLSVKEHMAMETLEATIDRLHHKVVVTETHAVHSLIVILQSTKLQYLELFHLPPSASKWSVLVNSVPAKPVKGETEESSILVPLLVGLNPETANQGGSLQTSVEITYFSKHEGLGKNGTLSMDPPQFDMPVSVLTTHLSLPRELLYNFTGNVRERVLVMVSAVETSRLMFISFSSYPVRKPPSFSRYVVSYSCSIQVCQGQASCRRYVSRRQRRTRETWGCNHCYSQVGAKLLLSTASRA